MKRLISRDTYNFVACVFIILILGIGFTWCAVHTMAYYNSEYAFTYYAITPALNGLEFDGRSGVSNIRDVQISKAEQQEYEVMLLALLY